MTAHGAVLYRLQPSISGGRNTLDPTFDFVGGACGYHWRLVAIPSDSIMLGVAGSRVDPGQVIGNKQYTPHHAFWEVYMVGVNRGLYIALLTKVGSV